MRISDWSSDVCSSDLQRAAFLQRVTQPGLGIVIEIVAASLEIGQRACVQRGEAGYVIARQLHQRPRRAGQRSGNRHGASVGIAACSISDTARGATPFASFLIAVRRRATQTQSTGERRVGDEWVSTFKSWW